jgi:hypothetical protein
MRYIEVDLGEIKEILDELEAKVSRLPLPYRKELKDALKPVKLTLNELMDRVLESDD